MTFDTSTPSQSAAPVEAAPRHTAAGELIGSMKAALFTLALLLAGHAPAARAQVPLPPLEARSPISPAR